MTKRLVIDLDGTLTVDDSKRSYAEKQPNPAVIARVREYKAAGFEVVVHSSRNMRTYVNSIGKINVHALPVVIAWLQRHDVPFDEIDVGKPWCGTEGFYVDDRTIRPDEFVRMKPEEVAALLDPSKSPPEEFPPSSFPDGQ